MTGAILPETFSTTSLGSSRGRMKAFNVIAYGASAVLGALVVVGYAVYWGPSPAPKTESASMPKRPPVASREVVRHTVGGSEEERWVVRTDREILRIPAKYVGPHDPERGFYHMFFYWPGLDPVIKHPAGGRTSRDVVQIYLHVKREFPPRPFSEMLESLSKSYGEPRPTPDSPGMLEYPNKGKGRTREFLAVDVSPPSWRRGPFFVSCSLDLTCRSYIQDIHDARVLVDFYPEHLPNAQRLYRDVFGMLQSFYEPNRAPQPTR